MTDEAAYWRRLIEELRAVPMTVSKIAEELAEEERMIWKWRSGTRPTGWSAIGLFLLHTKYCPESPRHISPIAQEENSAQSRA